MFQLMGDLHVRVVCARYVAWITIVTCSVSDFRSCSSIEDNEVVAEVRAGAPLTARNPEHILPQTFPPERLQALTQVLRPKKPIAFDLIQIMFCTAIE